MVPFRRRSMGKLNTIKHIIDSDGGLTGGIKSVNVIANSVITRNATFNPNEVELGSHIYGFYISLFMIGASGSGVGPSQNWYIAKARAGQDPSTDFPSPGSTGAAKLRSQIFHEEKGLVGSADGTPMAFKGVVVVPKGMQRVRDGDQIFIAINSSDAVNDANFCLKAIYKEFQ